MDDRRKRLAVFVGQADESYQSRFLTGFTRNTFALDMDVCVFSMYHKYQNTSEREKGEVNIFSLFRPELFDGAVILEDTIQTPGTAARLEEQLHESFNKPVLVIELESKYFPSVLTQCSKAVNELVSHLIEVHGCKDIAFLSGKKWHRHAQDRLKAVRDTMEAHGLTLPDERVIYGDFWYQSGELCADQLCSSGQKLPDAVVCANDAMAIGLCKALDARGLRIPEDIAVVSYDSTPEGQTSPVTVTSSLLPAEEIGSHAAEYIYNKLNGRDTPPFDVSPRLLIGESCGCTHTDMPSLSMRRKEWGTDISEEGFRSVNNSLVEDLFAQTTLTDYLNTLYSYAYQINGAEAFHLCLCDCWRDLGKRGDISCGNDGYTENMIYAVRYNSDKMDGLAGTDTVFPARELLPDLNVRTERPRAVFFTPVFVESVNFGYAAVEFGSAPRSYDDTYRGWLRMLMGGIESLRRSLELKFAQETVSKLKNSKFSPAGSAYERIGKDEKADFELVARILDGNLLTYRFQPIVSTVDGSIYSYEALMRSAAERKISPLSIIKYADMQNRLPDVERATFLNVLKIADESLAELGRRKIFINSIPGVRVSEEDMKTIEGYFNRLYDTIVVELTEEAELGDEDLERMKALFGTHRIKIAVDDYGSGYSNVNNLLRYMPDYVKIDRALLSNIQDQPRKQHFVKEIIKFCHDNNIRALAEGIENSEELRTVINLGADLIQGFYTGRPADGFTKDIDENVRKEILTYREEYLNGGQGSRYIAGKTNRVVLSALMKDNFSEIVIGQGAMIYKDITVIGAPGVRSGVHITVEPEYTGRITLENAFLTNSIRNPCIRLGENSDVTLVIVGENTLRNSGILVPESAKLTVEGEGSLKIDLHSAEFFGIGELPDKKAGEMIFLQSGTVEITGHGVTGCCIGAGYIRNIVIGSGRFILDTNGQRTVGIGSLKENLDLEINNSCISVDINSTKGVGIGSFAGSSGTVIGSSEIRMTGSGSDIVGIGTMEGMSSDSELNGAGIFLKLNAVNLTGIGALNGSSRLEAVRSVIGLEISGQNALAAGGYNGDTLIELRDSETTWNLKNKINTDCYAFPDCFRIIGGKHSFTVNDTPVEREETQEQ